MNAGEGFAGGGSFSQRVAETADRAALDAYVAALPDAERVAYYMANRDYCLGTTPAYILHEAAEIRRTQGVDASDLFMRDYNAKAFAASEAAYRASLPGIDGAQRVFAATASVVNTVIYGGLVTLAVFVGAGPHMAAGVATFACGLGAINALASYVRGR